MPTTSQLEVNSPMMYSTISDNRIKKYTVRTAVIIFWIAVWQVAACFVSNPTILPSPLQVAERLFGLVRLPYFWRSTGLSCLRIIIGFFIGCAVGGLFGVLTFVSKVSKYLLEPVLLIIKTTPVASFIILLLVWFRNESIPSFISVLIVMPLICRNVFEAFLSVDKKTLDAAKVFELTFFQKLKIIYFPALKSYFLAAFSTSLGFAFKAGIAAEILCTPKNSIGKEIYNAKIYLETESVFAWTAVVIVLSLLFEVIFVKIIMGRRKNDKN